MEMIRAGSILILRYGFFPCNDERNRISFGFMENCLSRRVRHEDNLGLPGATAVEPVDCEKAFIKSAADQAGGSVAPLVSTDGEFGCWAVAVDAEGELRRSQPNRRLSFLKRHGSGWPEGPSDKAKGRKGKKQLHR